MVLLGLLFAYIMWNNSSLIDYVWIVLYFLAFSIIGFLVSTWSVCTIAGTFDRFKGRSYNPYPLLFCSFIGLGVEVFLFRMLISYDIFTYGLVLALSMQAVSSVVTFGIQCWCYRTI
jgi:hypothetical protein